MTPRQKRERMGSQKGRVPTIRMQPFHSLMGLHGPRKGLLPAYPLNAGRKTVHRMPFTRPRVSSVDGNRRLF